MLGILFGIWLVKYLAGTQAKIEKPPLIFLLLGFIGLVLISSLLTANPKTVLKEFLSERIIGIIIVYFLIFQLVRDKETIIKVTRLLLISAFIIAFLGVIEELIQCNLFYEIGKYLVPADKLSRLGFDNFAAKRFGIFLVQSSFPISNGLAAYLVFILPIALSITFFIKKKSLAILMLFSILILFLCLIFTASMGGYIGIGIILFILWKTKPIIKCSLLLLFVLTIIGWFYFTGTLVKERGFHRFWQLVAVTQTVSQHPMGTGLNTFNEAVKVLPRPGESELIPADGYAYSQQILVETGVLSFIILAIIWLILLYRIRETSKEFQKHDDRFWQSFSWALFTAFATNIILSLGTHSILNTNNGIIVFWISVALAMRLWIISKSS